MEKIIKFCKYLLYGLMGITALFGLLFYFGVMSEGPFLMLSYIFTIVATLAAVLFPIFQVISNPKKGKSTLLGVAVITVVAFLTYFLGSGETLNILGYTGPDNVPHVLKLTDMGLFTTYLLMIAAFFVILGTEIYNATK